MQDSPAGLGNIDWQQCPWRVDKRNRHRGHIDLLPDLTHRVERVIPTQKPDRRVPVGCELTLPRRDVLEQCLVRADRRGDRKKDPSHK